MADLPGGGHFAAYRHALAIAPFRRLLVGETVTCLGDGAGYVAVAWLALQLARPAERPYAVGLALAAYALPGTLVGLMLASRLARVSLRRLLVADCVTRMAGLACIAGLYFAGSLPLALYTALLAASSLFTVIGRSGFVSVVARHVPEELRFGANSLVNTSEMVMLTLLGPAVGGVLVAVIGAASVIAIDAGCFTALLWAALRLPPSTPAEEGPEERVRLRALVRRPLVGWLLALTVVFYGLYGPLETALPIFVRTDLHAGSRLFGVIWGTFGIGSLVGGVLAGTRVIKRVELFAVVVVAGWGLAVVVVGATSIPAVVCVGMLVGGFVFAPYPAVTTTALQQALSERELAAGAAGWFAMTSVVTSVTIALGGPMVAAFGARATVLASGVATAALAVLVTAGRRARAPAV